MGAPSAVASEVASLSLTGGKTYNLSDISSKQAEQVYEEIDYSSVEVKPDIDPYTAATKQLIEDENFIKELLNKIKEKLDAIDYEKADIVVQNMQIFCPSLIRICDHSEELQNGKTLDEYIKGVEKILIDFGFNKRDLLSERVLKPEDENLVLQAAQEIVLENMGSDPEFLEVFGDSESKLALSYIKTVLKEFANQVIKSYGDDVLKVVLGNCGDDVLRLATSIMGKAPFFTGCFLDCAFSGFDDVMGTLESDFLSKFMGTLGDKSNLVANLTSSFIPRSASQLSPGIAKYIRDGSYLSLTHFAFSGNVHVEGTAARNVAAFWSKSTVKGSKEAFLKKWFIPKNCVTTGQFAEEVVKSTSKKAIACQAVGSGVMSLVVGSSVSFIAEGVDTWKETGDLGLALQAGGAKVIDDLPKNTAAAVGTAVGTVAGSAAGGFIGSFICPPIGTYIGAKVGGFLGGLGGGILGETIYNVAEADIESGGEKAWYKPWTWFS